MRMTYDEALAARAQCTTGDFAIAINQLTFEINDLSVQILRANGYLP